MDKKYQDLKNFYNIESKKYYETRKKVRNDWNIILQELKNYPKKKIKILEFWCWSGRLISYLNQNLKWKIIEYEWIDISEKLLEYAKKDNKDNIFICDNIVEYIEKAKQESFDFIIWIASFQHIKTKKERFFLMNQFYNKLKYWGELIMTNRSFSKRFIRKYSKEIISAILKSSYTSNMRNDIDIPRTNKWITHKRYYHIFTKKELKNLTKISWFKCTLTFLDKKWQIINNWKNSNNTFVIWKKECIN